MYLNLTLTRQANSSIILREDDTGTETDRTRHNTGGRSVETRRVLSTIHSTLSVFSRPPTAPPPSQDTQWGMQFSTPPLPGHTTPTLALALLALLSLAPDVLGSKKLRNFQIGLPLTRLQKWKTKEFGKFSGGENIMWATARPSTVSTLTFYLLQCLL